MIGGLGGKLALVSGSTSGIGLKVAEGLAKMGASVIINGRTSTSVQEAVPILKAVVADADILTTAADLGTAEGCSKIIETFPKVDILINNLGVFDPKSFSTIQDSEWMKIFEVNVMSGVRLSRHYLPHMLEQNWGRIVNVSSEAGLFVLPEMLHYSLTKTAMYSLSRGLAELTKGSAVTVNAVAPGSTITEKISEWLATLARQQGKPLSAVEKEYFSTGPGRDSLIGRFLTEEEVANPILYLASQGASGTNGSVLRVDGGTHRAVI